jgi:hypothetical protein
VTPRRRRRPPAGRRRLILRSIPASAFGPLVLLAAALAACGGTAAVTQGAPGAAPAAIEARPADNTEPPREIPGATETAARPERAYPEPASLRGIDGSQLTGLLGTPRFKRRDDPAEIWQYRTESCSLDFFLYRSKDDPAYRVRHVEARGRGPAPQTEKECLAGLLKARERGGAG